MSEIPERNERFERHLAYHESGHAAAFYSFGREIKLITIVPENRIQGRVESSIPDWSEDSLVYLQEELVCLICGLTAAAHFDQIVYPSEFYDPHYTEYVSDVAAVDGKNITLILQLQKEAGVDPDESRRQAQNRAEQFVSSNWARIDVLAQTVLIEKTLRKEHAQDVLQYLFGPRKKRRPGFWAK